jgi:DNA polymerase III, gamma/tau subunits
VFENLIGNENIKSVFKRLLAAKRVPNSLLFTGPEGVGKRQFALQLAKSLVCRQPVSGQACDECPACRRAGVFVFPKPDDKDAHEKVIFSGHPDAGTVIPYKRNILVEAIRDLETAANFRPYEAPVRFFMIDQAEKMNAASSNALLKTLEEPPPTTHIVLITARPDSLLQTIRSRCQTINFAPVAANEIRQYLIDEKGVSPMDAGLIAKLSVGSVGKVLAFDLDVFRERRSVMVDVLRNALTDNNRAALLQISETLNDAKNKDSYEGNLDILETLIRDLWLIKLNGDSDEIVNADILNDLLKLADSIRQQTAAAWLNEIEMLRQSFLVNINRKIATDALFVEMAVA